MDLVEPYRLKHWQVDTSEGDLAHFYTCARPGRSKGPKGCVPDWTVTAWVLGLPGPATAIVSLLGRKQGKSGASEYSFYSFSGGFDSTSERGRQPSFQEWLDIHHGQRQILVREHPTYDYRPITHVQLTAIYTDIHDLIAEGRTVVVMDSGGETRTGKVCRRMGATRMA